MPFRWLVLVTCLHAHHALRWRCITTRRGTYCALPPHARLLLRILSRGAAHGWRAACHHYTPFDRAAAVVQRSPAFVLRHH